MVAVAAQGVTHQHRRTLVVAAAAATFPVPTDMRAAVEVKANMWRLS